MDKNRQAWSLIGLFNLIAVVLIAVIVLQAMGFELAITWQWILGGGIASLALMAILLWSILRAEG